MTDRRAILAAVALVVAVLGSNAWSAARSGWAPEGDSAAITVRTHDVLSTHPPLLGNPTTAGSATGEDLRHPGPLEFVALAIPLRLFGVVGMLVGAALLASASVVAIGWLAHRNGPPLLALWLVAGVAVLVWSFGDEIPHDVYNPHALLLPYALLVVCGWAAACGDRAALPIAVVAASFVAQSHAYYALLAAVVGLGVVVATARFARPSARWWLASAAVGLALWIPPLLAELRPGPSNLLGLLRVGTGSAEVDEAPMGVGYASARLADTVLGGRWLDRRPHAFELIQEPSAGRQLLTVALLVVLGSLGWRAGRRGHRATAALVATALLSAAASLVAAARLPAGVPLLEPHSHRHWWITGAVVWLAAGWTAAWFLRTHLRRLPAWSRRVVVAVPLVLAAVAAGWQPSIDDDRGSVSFGAVDHFADALADELPSGGPWLVEAEGAQAALSVQPGVVAVLAQRGFDVRVGPAEAAAMGSHRLVDGPVAGRVLVLSADEAPSPPPGYTLVARFDAVADAARHGRENAVLFDHPQQLAVAIAVPDEAGSASASEG